MSTSITQEPEPERLNLFKETKLQQHLYHYSPEYCAEAIRVFNSTLSRKVPLGTKTKIVATLLWSLDKETFKALYSQLELPEVLKACQLLDTPRLIRQLNKKLDGAVHSRVPGLMELLAEEGAPSNLSLSRTRCRMVRDWLASLTAEKLDWIAAFFPLENWTKLADLVHPNPSTFSLNWFLPYCYGKIEPPQESLSHLLANLNSENFTRVYREHKIPYKNLRLKEELRPCNMDVQFRVKNAMFIARHEDLGVVLWYYDEIVVEPLIEKTIAQRLANGEVADLTYGGLVNLLTRVREPELHEALVTIAQSRLEAYVTGSQDQRLILCDASASMQVAIKTSGIISSILCALSKHTVLNVFRKNNQPIKEPPTTVKQALKFAKEIKAHSSTSPAASLEPFLHTSHKRFNTIVVVTDEEENTNSKGQWTDLTDQHCFAHTYLKYLKSQQNHPVRLILVSFSDPKKDAPMTVVLKQVLGKRYEELVSVFKYDLKNPDLNKLDILLEHLG